MVKLAPSILAADMSKLGLEVQAVERAGAEYLHIDVMDGVFVPSMSFGFPIIKSIRKMSNMVFDVHLMIVDPIRYVDEFAKYGADIISVHVEACKDLKTTLNQIKLNGVKCGVVINPETPVEEVYSVLNMVDMVLVMTVKPGFGGQELMEETLNKVAALRKYIDDNGYGVEIEVDGGIKPDNIQKVVGCGADVIVAGSAIFKNDIGKNIEELKNRIEEIR